MKAKVTITAYIDSESKSGSYSFETRVDDKLVDAGGEKIVIEKDCKCPVDQLHKDAFKAVKKKAFGALAKFGDAFGS